MASFEIVPVEVWLALALAVLVFIALRWRAKRRREQRRQRMNARHHRNIGHQRAWHWVFGRGRKTLRLSDQRPPEAD